MCDAIGCGVITARTMGVAHFGHGTRVAGVSDGTAAADVSIMGPIPPKGEKNRHKNPGVSTKATRAQSLQTEAIERSNI